MQSYYLSILGLGVANLVLATIAYAQRAKQIRGNALREHQIALAEARNELAERRLRCLDDQLAILGEIRDVVCADLLPPVVGVIDIGSATVRLVVARLDPKRSSFVQLCKSGDYLQLGPEVERHGGYTQATLLLLAGRLRALVAASERAGCERLAVVVTAPGRVGGNVAELLRVVGQATGHDPLLLAPEEEARLTFAGATMGSAAADVTDAVVCDVGGGSTEIAVGSPRAGITASTSFEIGAFVLAERHFHP
jgi:Ppx/GppA phosphatase family protein